MPSFALELGLSKADAAFLTMVNHVTSALAPFIIGVVTSLGVLRPHIPEVGVGLFLLNAGVEAAAYYVFADIGGIM